MQPDSLVKLLTGGNLSTVEEEWMRTIDSADMTPARLAAYDVVLAELCKMKQTKRAETLAWTALESIKARSSAAETLQAAGPFLLSIGESQELRDEVASLYESAHAGREGLVGLLNEAGIRGGRPVRRALRTLDVCLAVDEGDYLVSRDDERAARIDSVDSTTWEYNVTDGQGAHTVGAVALADQYQPASESDFRVMRRFTPDRLKKFLSDDPSAVIIDVCKRHGNKVDSHTLESVLVPDPIPAASWDKWWSQARAALKKCPNLKIEGRSPYVITYNDVAVRPEDAFLSEFEGERDVAAQFAVVDKYLKDCRSRKEMPAVAAIRQCCRTLRDRAVKRTDEKVFAGAAQLWLMVDRIAKAADLDDLAKEARSYFAGVADIGPLIANIENDSLVESALDAAALAKPGQWTDQLLVVFPTLTHSACDVVATRLADAGRTPDDFESSITKIVDSPVAHFGALSWLWDLAATDLRVKRPPSLTLLTRILQALEECRRNERIPRETAKDISTQSRAVLSARKYGRFEELLGTLETGMASALRTQIGRVENLGRAVREDMLKMLNKRFPSLSAKPETPTWLRTDVLYVTNSGLVKKHEELDHHLNVKMKENARAIGRAAELGDLSENSEYKFALEERDLLRARLAQMNAELAKARVITAADVPTQYVGVGTCVLMRRADDGSAYELTFLGPWEADPTKNQFNYQAPIAQRLMGKRVGDPVDLDIAGSVVSFEIVGLSNALDY